MTTAAWRWLRWVSAGAGVVCALAGGVAWWTFRDMLPVDAGAPLAPSITRVVDGYVTAHLVENPDGSFILVDCGMTPGAGPIVAALQSKGKSVDDVRAVLLTHGHPDHTAGCAAFPKANLFVHGDEQALLTGKVSARGPLTRWMAPVDAGLRASWVDDDMRMKLGGSTIHGVHVPGHTDGSMAWMVGDTLFLGDSADGARSGVLLPAAWVFTDDRATNKASLKKLARAVSPAVLVFAHSGALPGEALQQASAW